MAMQPFEETQFPRYCKESQKDKGWITWLRLGICNRGVHSGERSWKINTVLCPVTGQKWKETLTQNANKYRMTGRRQDSEHEGIDAEKITNDAGVLVRG